MNNSSLSSFFFILLIILVLLTVFGVAYLYITSKSKERLALIEKGMDPNLAKSDFWLQIGIIAGGSAFGLIAGDLIPGKFGPLVAIFFAGTGLVLYNIIRKNVAKRK
ncbi:hypothetical protein EFY79_19110 [Hanamia caeni]|uniref:Uncharacterized protein n=1 Tax=Hanamia caeni TaxID=2294116 RepID=A0A3M9N6S6_9BACT|nr:hypothetical protein [Hanamia caeni]RNI33436.1 hypothetical protein EFY79_19110 [Hanamia caeni]